MARNKNAKNNNNNNNQSSSSSGKDLPPLLSLLHASMNKSFQRISKLLVKDKQKQRNKNNLVVSSPHQCPPQSYQSSHNYHPQPQYIHHNSDMPLPSYLASSKPPLNPTTVGDSNKTEVTTEIIRNPPNKNKSNRCNNNGGLRTDKSVHGHNIKQYDKRAMDIFPCTFNLISGSYDALVSDTAVLVKNKDEDKVGGFTDVMLEILNNDSIVVEEANVDYIHNAIGDGEEHEYENGIHQMKTNMTWELFLKRMGQQLLKEGYNQVPQLLSTRLLDVQKPMTIINEMYGTSGTKRAVLVGINYIGQKGELKKCHKDVHKMETYLKTKLGFEEKNIVKLMDDGIHTNPTKENIMNAYRKVVRQSIPGDTVFIHYSGHGGHVVDESGDEEDGFDETIIPVDFETNGEIVDDDLADELVKRMAKGVLVTALMDTHNGGSVLDLPYYFTGEVMKRSYDPYEDYDGEVFMISGCHDAQESVCTDPKKFLPSPHGRKSGAFTSALLKSLYDAHQDSRILTMSWVDMLKVLRSHLCDKGFNQVPQLSSTRLIDLNKPLKIINREEGTRRAVLIGINYVGKKNALPGCHNDVKNMVVYLKTMQGFKDENITILMDDGKHTNPTHANIMNAYTKIVEDSVAGDTVFLHFSGHGAQILDRNGDEDDGYDETLIPVDFETAGHIVDDELNTKIIKKFGKGVLVTALMDSCHSGTALDLPYYFNGEGGVDAMERLEQFAFTDIAPVKPKFCCFGR